MPTHTLPIGMQNIIKPIPVQDLLDISLSSLNNAFSSHDATDKFEATMPFPAEEALLNITIKDNEYFNLPISHSITSQHLSLKHLPTKFKHDFWIVCMHNDKPATADSAIETIKSLIAKGCKECVFRFCKHRASNKTLLEEYRVMLATARPITKKSSTSTLTTSALSD